ncbi:MAG: tyrosine--tRNA ligase [Desulfarculales bacterium]|jgi:tyrosyl-tRNA synthetase|nr:tyrosine--tRNA ligase [Desulfarculales bacterium]
MLYQNLQERGFIAQCSNEAGLSELLEQGRVTGYIGYDPTATSLHVGHLLPIICLIHVQRAGHIPLVLVGGGTGLVGDPSGRTEMRDFLTAEKLEENVKAIKTQLSRFLDLSPGKGLMLNNADWLRPLHYLDFLRDIGRHFSVNRMLAAESVKSRLERGMSFIEFNYSLLQAYDFMYLAQHHDCRLQLGGNDQWGNIVAGADLSRRMLGKEVFGLTLPLLTTAGGAKMGKTAGGAVWLDARRTSVYDFYQFWINTADEDVIRFLKLFTFLSLEEIETFAHLRGADLREPKQILAWQVCALVHGREAADAAQAAAAAAFGGPEGGDPDAVPSTKILRSRLREGIPAFILLHETGLSSSSSEARRLISQGGAYVGERKITSFDQLIGLDQADRTGTIWLRAGKKKHHRVLPA